MANKNLLVELGTEELPPKALRKLAVAFKDGFTNELKKADLSFSSVEWYATPRRLALKVIGLSEKQPDKSVEIKGPSVQVAFKDGQPTQVGQAWAKAQGIELSQAETITTPKGEWLVYRTVKSGQNTVSLIADFVKTALGALPIPKLMHWGSKRELFVRPVHTLTMLFGNELIPGSILGLESSRTIRGHRFMGESEFEINSADEYPEILETKGMVIADYERRKKMIVDAITKQAKDLNGTADMDEDLIEEVTSLVEYPVLMTAKFEEKFLAVPAEALVHTMKGDQKYFPVYRDGKLLPNFIFISNIISKNPEMVISGNERVVRPRLADAEFFYNTDKKKTLQSRFESLKTILFQKQLGSLADKSEIVAEVATEIANKIGANPEYAKRAGLLSKCDLMTNMVMEFTDTQGIMGMHYARIDGEPEEVALAMNEQYMPRFSGDSLPSNKVSCAVSIAEKITTLTGIFGINQIPKGDKDPFGLRRASIGVIRIAIEKELNLDIRPLIEFAAKLYADKLTNTNVVNDVVEYILGRFKAYYQESGIGADIVQSVLATGVTNLFDFDKRIKAVEKFKTLNEAESLAASNKRVGNILAKAEGNPAFNESLLKEEAEIALYKAMSDISATTAQFYNAGNYTDALSTLSSLKEPVDNFFDKVMVNCEDAAVKNNRLALLRQLRDMFTHIADISLIQK
ncbi:MAG: glycine--tRNA ligase subunit beta [Ruminobacter sp.]|jgi:glycyl-tRNA synthetase beta chain|uniref:Glycine--tRNA ligase beta subunit n=1 Tax=Ruminobacter amylophilus TaxID=867 RepID=A0A662ZJF3_9GAMM|nr:MULTISPECIES: glycine--tRNA ligase subunit beta [Ruminobacter]MBQ3776370.1 glycine--tRNA ligase subunit beta [Ruminobacter sp.]SFP66190.1 glycyl-tRNA synthetase beta chain [Ruminobacter amylophilus]